jgi:hypothetical protein
LGTVFANQQSDGKIAQQIFDLHCTSGNRCAGQSVGPSAFGKRDDRFLPTAEDRGQPRYDGRG